MIILGQSSFQLQHPRLQRRQAVIEGQAHPDLRSPHLQRAGQGGRSHPLMRVGSGDAFIVEGEQAEEFYVVLAGEVEVQKGGARCSLPSRREPIWVRWP
jgi:CRP-like cAMP-binding protein